MALGVEAALVLGLLALYRLGRTLASGHVEEAEHNAATYGASNGRCTSSTRSPSST